MNAQVSSYKLPSCHPKVEGTTLAVIGDNLEGLAGMEERALAYGYRLEKYLCSDHPDPWKLLQTLYNRCP